MPYLSGLMELYMHLLATGSSTIRETVICGIGSAAHAAGSVRGRPVPCCATVVARSQLTTNLLLGEGAVGPRASSASCRMRRCWTTSSRL